MKKIKAILYISLLAIYSLPIAGQAKITDDMLSKVTGSSLETLPEGGSIEIVVGNIIQALLSIFGIIFLVLMVYGGFIWLKAQGREQEVTRAKDTIRSAIIGLAIVLAAYTITYFVVQNLVSATLTK